MKGIFIAIIRNIVRRYLINVNTYSSPTKIVQNSFYLVWKIFFAEIDIYQLLDTCNTAIQLVVITNEYTREKRDESAIRWSIRASSESLSVKESVCRD